MNDRVGEYREMRIKHIYPLNTDRKMGDGVAGENESVTCHWDTEALRVARLNGRAENVVDEDWRAGPMFRSAGGEND